MPSPNTRSTKDLIIRDTYITGIDNKELKRAENYLQFIDEAIQGMEEINSHIENLDHIGIGNCIHNLKPTIMNMGYSSLYTTATALENEFINQIISHPRPNLEDFLSEMNQAVLSANSQLEGMRVSLI